MDTELTVEGSASADAKLTDRKLISFGLDTALVADLANEFLKPEKIIPLLEEHKSGVIVASLWLVLHLRSWLSVLPLPIPSLATLPLVFLALISLSLATPARTLAGLAHFSRTEMSASATSFARKVTPAWLSRVVFIALLFPVSRAAVLVFVWGTWDVVSKYRNAIAGVADEADATIRCAASAVEKVGESVREAKQLEIQAMLLAAAAAHGDDVTSKETVETAIRVKKEVEEMSKSAALLLETKAGKARNLAERAKTVAQEGSPELAREMVVNAGKLVEKVVQGEKTAREEVEQLRKMLWDLSLGDNVTC